MVERALAGRRVIAHPTYCYSCCVHDAQSSQFLGMGSTPLENTTLIIPQLVNKSSGSAGPFAASSGIYLPRPDEASLQANRPRSSDDRKLSANGGRDRDSVEAGLLDTEVVEASRECCTTRNVPYREGEGIPISRSIRRIFGRPSTQVLDRRWSRT